MILAELAGGIALRLEHRCHRHIGLLPALLGTGEADLRHSRAHRHVAADEGSPPRGTALLAVVVGERDTLAGDPVDVRGLVAHHAAVVVADVPGADVVSPDDEDVRLLAGGNGLALLGGGLGRRKRYKEADKRQDETQKQRRLGHGVAPKGLGSKGLTIPHLLPHCQREPRAC